MYRTTVTWWFCLGLIALLFICSWITMLIVHSFHEPLSTPAQQAASNFIQSCEDQNGVPNTQLTSWTCQEPSR